MLSDSNEPKRDSLETDNELENLFAVYVDRLNRGERFHRQEILAKHPLVGEELIQCLEDYVELERVPEWNEPLSTLGDYTLCRQIGRGGMGVVYEAWQGSMDRRVALKVLPPGVAADDKAFHRFMREAKAAGKLDHQNIVSVHAAGFDDSTPYFSMEYVEGETLAQVLRVLTDAEAETASPFGPKDQGDYFIRLAHAFADVADGLQHAHSKGVIHRDIKPSNLILDVGSDQGGSFQGRLRILDFGLAHLEGQDSLTLSGDLVGTPAYMSPEQARRQKIPVDHRTDIYSLGATMYEVFTGLAPFRGRDHAETLSQIIDRDARPLRQLNARVPEDLETLVLKCLRKDAGERYGSAEALAQDLRRFVRGDPIEARPEGRWTRCVRRALGQRRRIGTAAVTVFACVAGALLLRDSQARRQDQIRRDYEEKVLAALVQFEEARLLESADATGALSIRQPELLAADETVLRRTHRVLEGVRRLEDATRSLPGRPEAYYSKARGLVLLDQADEAEKALDRALAADPNFLPAILLRSELRGEEFSRAVTGKEEPRQREWVRALLPAHRAVREARPRETAKAFTELIRFEEKHGEPYLGASIEARLGRGIAHLEAQNQSQAIEDFAVCRDRYPTYLEPVLLLARAYYQKGEEHESARAFAQSYDNAEANRRDGIALWIATIYSSERDFARGLNWAKKISDDFLKASLTSYFYWSLGQLEEAERTARDAIRLRPDEAIPWQRLALTLFFKSDFSGALEAASKAVALRPELADGHFLRSACLVWLEKPNEAVVAIEEAIRLRPEAAHYHARLGRALHRAGRAREAKKVCEDFLRRAPRSAGVLSLLGLLLKEEKDWERAEVELRKAVECWEAFRTMNPNARAVYSSTLVHLGDVLRRKGDPLRAFDCYRKAIERMPDDAFAHRRLCKLARSEHAPTLSGRWDAFIGALEEKLEASSPGAVPLNTLAVARMQAQEARDLEKALAFARLAARRSGEKNAALLLTLAEAQYFGGDKESALKTLNKARTLPNPSRKIGKRLEEYSREGVSN